MNRRAIAALTALAGCGGSPGPVSAPAPMTGVEQRSNTTALLIGISPVNDRVVWVSGARGTYVRTTDGGATWAAAQVPGAEGLQFRDIHALDENTAWLLSIGSADTSRVFSTSNGGKTWSLQFTNPLPKGFLDCFSFWDPLRGLAISDAVDGQVVLWETVNGGITWGRVPPDRLPAGPPEEGSFAASGTCLVTLPGGHAWIAVGTPKARLLHTADYGRSWTSDSIPLVAISSVAFRDPQHGIVLGTDSSAATASTDDGGRTWVRGGKPPFPRGVYGGVFVPGARVPTVVAAGPAGLAWSGDNGTTWNPINSNGYWSVGFASRNAGWAIGPNGRITRLGGF